MSASCKFSRSAIRMKLYSPWKKSIFFYTRSIPLQLAYFGISSYQFLMPHPGNYTMHTATSSTLLPYFLPHSTEQPFSTSVIPFVGDHFLSITKPIQYLDCTYL